MIFGDKNTFIEIEDETIQAKLGIGCFFDTRMSVGSLYGKREWAP